MSSERTQWGSGGSSPEDATETALRGALSREADRIDVGHDGLRRIRAAIEADRGHPRTRAASRWMPLLAAAALLLVAGAGALLFGLPTGRGGTPAVTPTGGATSVLPSPAPTAEPTPSASGEPSVSADGGRLLNAVPVYWIGPSRPEQALFREFRSVPDRGGAVASAVSAMLTQAPLDPDYFSPWRPADVSVKVAGKGVVVDLSADAFSAGVPSRDTARLAVQQLVWTATAAAHTAGQPDSSVTVLVDGRSGYLAWGLIRLGGPMGRDASAQAEIWVSEPVQGGTARAGAVTVRGQARAFEGTLSWEVTRRGGSNAGGIVKSGTAQTRGDIIAPYLFTVSLQPGSYTVTVYEASMADGSRLHADSKDFTVT